MERRAGWIGRRSPRLVGYDYGQPALYFVTICTWLREPVLGEVVDSSIRLSLAERSEEEVWQALPLRFQAIDLDAFVIMPDHVHGIIVLGTEPDVPPATATAKAKPTLSAVLRVFTSVSGIAGNRAIDRAGQPFWQRSFYDRIIRNERELTAIRRYIEDNPSRWATVATVPPADPAWKGSPQ
jgi:putative transposase